MLRSAKSDHNAATLPILLYATADPPGAHAAPEDDAAIWELSFSGPRPGAGLRAIAAADRFGLFPRVKPTSGSKYSSALTK
jgi:hypothetical protein